MATRIVVEWTRTSLRLALAEERKGRARALTVRGRPLGSAEDAAAALRALLGKLRVADAHVLGVVPREQVITRVVKFPSLVPAELAQMVELYAKAQLPYAKDQAVTDFHVVSRREGFSTVAIVACQRDVVERPLGLLREAGLAPHALTVSSWGVLAWYRLLRDGRTPSEPLAEPCLVMNADESRTDFVLIADGRLLSSRSLSQGTADWSSAADPTELLAVELERSRAAVRKEVAEHDARSILLTGLGPLEDWRESLARRLDLPVAVADAGKPFAGSEVSIDSAGSPVVAAGLACGTLGSVLNLNPPEARAQMRHRRQVRELITVSLLLLGVLALGSGALGLQLWREQRLASQLDRVVAQLEPEAKRVQAKGRSTAVVSSCLEEQRRLAGALAGVFRAIPATVALEGVAFERARRETLLRGSADSTQTVLDYIQQLSRVDGVKDVALKYSTRRSTASGERVDFELLLQMGSAAGTPRAASPRAGPPTRQAASRGSGDAT